jgi:hypothetical protein
MPKYLSGRSKLRDHQRFTNDRFEYLSIEQAEPNLGNPPNGTPAIYGSANLPTGDRYQIVSIEGYPGERYWVPVEGGIIPGSLTIFDETDTLVGGVNSITQINFIGAAITAIGSDNNKTTITLNASATYSFLSGGIVTQTDNPAARGIVFETTNASGIVTLTNVEGTFLEAGSSGGTLYLNGTDINKTPGTVVNIQEVGAAATVKITPEYFSSNKQLIFNDNDEFSGSLGLVYYKNSSTDNSNVGLASVGIGTTIPLRTLHVDGDIKLTGSIEDYNNSRGDLGDLLVKNNSGGIEWTDQRSVTVGAAGTFYEVQFHGNTGYLNGADKLVYRSDTQRIGIGSTQPTKLLDVLGDSIFTGDVTFVGLTTDAYWDKSANSFIVNDNGVIAVGDDRDLRIRHSSSNNFSYIDNHTSDLYIRNNVTDDNGGDIHIQAKSGEESIVCYDDGGVSLYFDSNLKGYTDSDGFVVYGRLYVDSPTGQESIFWDDVRFDGGGDTQFGNSDPDMHWSRQHSTLSFEDGASIKIGDSGDLRIFHTNPAGTILGILSTSTNRNLSIGASCIHTGIQTAIRVDYEPTGTIAHAELWCDGTKQVETISTGATIYGVARASALRVIGIATVDDVRIGHADGKIDTITGNLTLDSTGGTVEVDDILYVSDTTDSTGTNSGCIYVQGGIGVDKSVHIGQYCNVGGGVTSQNLDVSGVGTFNSLVLKDDKIAKFGDSDDLLIYHSVSGSAYANESYITAQNNGLNIEANSSGFVRIKGYFANGTLAKFNSGSSADLYYDGSKKLETTTSGIDVTGHTETDNLRVVGITTSNILDITGITSTNNLRVVGMSTAETNLNVLGITSTNNLNVIGVSTFLDKVGIGTTNPKTDLQVGSIYGVGVSSEVYTSSGTAHDIDSYDISNNNFRTAEYTVHFENGSNIQAGKVLIMNNSSTAYIQEYAVMFEPKRIVNLTATKSGNNIKLQATREVGITGDIEYRFVRHTML